MQIAELRNSAMSFDTAEKRPVFIGNNLTDEKILDSEHFAVWNLAKKSTAAIVSKQYNLVQHRHLIDEVSEAITNLNIPAEARVRDGGNKIFVDINFKNAKLYVGKGEEFYTGVRIINSYDKTTGIMILPHLVRLQCLNGMVVNVNWVKEFCVTHTSTLAKDFAELIPKMIQSMVDSSDKFKAMVNGCIGDSIEWELMDKIMNSLVLGRKKHMEGIKFRLQEIIQKSEDQNAIPTRWDLYNAFTSYATHGQQIKPSIESWLQNKAQRVLVTPLVQLVPKEEVTTE